MTKYSIYNGNSDKFELMTSKQIYAKAEVRRRECLSKGVSEWFVNLFSNINILMYTVEDLVIQYNCTENK